jgi:CelD/BcsL family acetyltransferase involved in cellulose biosynthesis
MSTPLSPTSPDVAGVETPTLFTTPAALSVHDHPASAWNRLALATPQPDPFCATTAWQLSWREAADPKRLLVVRECSEGLVQFARHTLRSKNVLGPVERLWMFGCNVLGPAGVYLLEQLIREPAMEAAGLGRRIVISGLDPQGPLLAEIRSRLSACGKFRQFGRDLQCAASLEGGLDGFLSRRSANHRKKLRQAIRRGQAVGIGFERHAPDSADAAAAVFARMLAVERRSWKGIADRGMDGPMTRIFYGSMLRRLAMARAGRVMFATHEGNDIGYIFGGMAGEIYRGQQFSFDETWRDMSIGNLLQYEQLAWLCEEGAHRYDMGPLTGPFMEYKEHWTEIRLPIEAWILG